MPDHPVSVHPPPPFDYDYYDSPFFRVAAEAATTRSGGHCQKCGRKLPLEAHHWAQGRYPPAKRLTAADLTGLCSECHGEAHQFRFILTAGGSLDEYRVAHSEIVARLLRPVDDGRQVGRAVWFEGQWAAFVTGGWSPPCGNEKFWLFQSSKRAWQLVAVAKVLSGRPGCWLVRKRFLVRPMRVAAVLRGTEQPAPAAMRQAAA